MAFSEYMNFIFLFAKPKPPSIFHNKQLIHKYVSLKMFYGSLNNKLARKQDATFNDTDQLLSFDMYVQF